MFQTLIFIFPTLMQFAIAQNKQNIGIAAPAYLQIKDCFPRLANDEHFHKVDLNRLKNQIDDLYPSSVNRLRYRRVEFLTRNDEKRRLRIESELKGKTPIQRLYLEAINSEGTAVALPVPESQSINPSAKVIREYLSDAMLLSDETANDDLKLNGARLSYRRQRLDVEALSLIDGKNQLECRRDREAGVLCYCSKKK